MRSFFFLFSLLVFTFHGAIARNLIYETCSSASRENRNVNYQFCKTSLLAAPTNQRTSVQKLGMFAITLIEKTMKDDMIYMNKLLKKKGLNKIIMNSITACSDLYSQTLDDLSDAILNYKSKNFYEVNQDVSAASTAAASCEDGFSERGVVSPLTQRNDKMGQLSAIALNIVNLYAQVQ